jgi:tRNA1Val (adenine37-N6)-methyltransferase
MTCEPSSGGGGGGDHAGAPRLEEKAASDRDLTTEDTLLQGRIRLLQPRRGFRSSLDPLLLAAFIARPVGRFIDIGCATGALSFLLADKDPLATGVAIEIQARLAALAHRGNARNGFEARLEILTGDVRSRVGCPPMARATFDLVATNPPFRTAEGAVTSPDPERAQANHELTLTLDEWLDCAARLLRPAGRLAVIYPAERLVPLIAGCEARRLSVARLRLVHARADRPACRVLLEARLQGRQTLAVEPPLLLHEVDGSFRPEVRGMLGMPGRASGGAVNEFGSGGISLTPEPE